MRAPLSRAFARDDERRRHSSPRLRPEAGGVTATTFGMVAWLLYRCRQYMPRKVRAVNDFLSRKLGGGPAAGRHDRQ